MKKDVVINNEKNAIILAAGFGMRMVPINKSQPKALLTVKNEVLIERLISQLHAAGITDIKIVVGYMKEAFEYLVKKYSVTLVENEQYSDSNNLYSLTLVKDDISNTFILPCDIWCQENPFLTSREESYYVTYSNPSKSKREYWDTMAGIAYITNNDADKLRNLMKNVASFDLEKTAFWEEVLYENEKIWIAPFFVAQDQVFQINTFEDLRNLDSQSEHLKSDVIDIICQTLQVNTDDIIEIVALKKGMTNRSFLFTCKNQKYIMRIPGEGTDMLINRKEEAEVYRTLSNFNISDDIVYINPKNGYKITKFLAESRNCDPDNLDDLIKCMKKLKEFHNHELTVGHRFDIFEQILFYERLRNGKPSVYSNYENVKQDIFALKQFIEQHVEKEVLAHIDAVPDNFLIVEKEEQVDIRLIDWEYSGMQDPHVDVAMFCIYSLYNKEQVDRLINIYFEDNVVEVIKMKIYAYIASCGLLWSNWCEYKSLLGIEFGDYAIAQYDYAEEYSKIVLDYLKQENRK